MLIRYGTLGRFPGVVAVHTYERERLVLQTLNERPLVGIHGPAGASPVSPEVEHDHLAAIIAQLELVALDIFAFDFQRFVADLNADLGRRSSVRILRLLSAHPAQSSVGVGAEIRDG